MLTPQDIKTIVLGVLTNQITQILQTTNLENMNDLLLYLYRLCAFLVFFRIIYLIYDYRKNKTSNKKEEIELKKKTELIQNSDKEFNREDIELSLRGKFYGNEFRYFEKFLTREEYIYLKDLQTKQGKVIYITPTFLKKAKTFKILIQIVDAKDKDWNFTHNIDYSIKQEGIKEQQDVFNHQTILQNTNKLIPISIHSAEIDKTFLVSHSTREMIIMVYVISFTF